MRRDEAEQCLLCFISSVLYPRRERPKRRSRSELPTTVTDERAIAAAAKMGAWAFKIECGTAGFHLLFLGE